MKIEVLGVGCKKCQALTELTRTALRELGLSPEVEHVTDLKRIMGYGVMATPALVMDGVVKCAGRVPSPGELRTWLTSQ